jgi:predicted dienelactone hydrolase
MTHFSVRRAAGLAFGLIALSVILILTLNLRGRPDWPAAGYHQAQVVLPGQAAPATVHIWYPADTGTVETVAETALFWGFPARPDAAPRPGDLPVILFSHGSGGRAIRNVGFLSALADAGFIVVAPDHPGSMSGDSDQRVTLDLSRRAAHLSALIDWLLTHPPANLRIDPDRIGVAGYSMGAHTALSLAGVRADAAALVRYCAEAPMMSDCQWYAAGGVDLTELDPNRFGARFTDSRVRAVFAIDPALPRAADPASLSGVTIPVQVVNLRDGTIPIGLDWSAPAALIPGAQWQAIDGATHFSAVTPCRLLGRIIIGLAPGGEGLCTDNTDTSRAAVTDALVAMAVPFFTSHLAQ